jgi:hypothetical protein
MRGEKSPYRAGAGLFSPYSAPFFPISIHFQDELFPESTEYRDRFLSKQSGEGIVSRAGEH